MVNLPWVQKFKEKILRVGSDKLYCYWLFYFITHDMNQDQAYYTTAIRQRVEPSLRTMIEHLKKQGLSMNEKLQTHKWSQPGTLLDVCCTLWEECWKVPSSWNPCWKTIWQHPELGSLLRDLRPLSSKLTPKEKGGKQITLHWVLSQSRHFIDLCGIELLK